MKSIIFVALLLLGACTSAKTSMMDERTAIIAGRGNAFVSMGDVGKVVAVEAARQATERGFRYFQFVSAQDQSRSGAIVVPGQSFSSGNASASCLGGMCSGSYTGQTYTTPGSIHGYVKPGADVFVRFYKEGEITPGTPDIWDARSVLAVKDK